MKTNITKRKIILALTAATAACCCAAAVAACSPKPENPGTGGYLPQPQGEILYGFEKDELTSAQYAVVTGFAGEPSEVIKIPSVYSFEGAEYPVLAVGAEAFKDCISVKEVKISAGVKRIADGAFSGCASLVSVTMGDSVESIGRSVFANCTSLNSLALSNSVEELKTSVFAGCSALKSLVLPDALKAIEEKAFEGCGITSFDTEGCEFFAWENEILINGNVTDANSRIAVYANPEAAEITVPQGVKIFDAKLFKGNKNIKKADLNGLEYVGVEAFADSALEELSGYDNLEDASVTCFSNTPWLENQTGDIIIGKTFALCRGSETSVTLPEGIATVGERAFAGTDVENVVLPQSLSNILPQAFADCKNLKSLTIRAGVPPLLSGEISATVKIYVPAGSVQYYKSNIMWGNLPNEILPLA